MILINQMNDAVKPKLKQIYPLCAEFAMKSHPPRRQTYSASARKMKGANSRCHPTMHRAVPAFLNSHDLSAEGTPFCF